MKVGLLVCGKFSAALSRQGISHPNLIQEWLKVPASAKVSFRIFRAYEGKLPPKVDSCDSYFVTGSAASMLDREPWMLKLANFLLIAAKAQVPVVGLCFGHQVLAQALGGNVKRAAKGWEIGIKRWKVVRQEGWMRECGKFLTLPMIHRDQVSKLPPRSVRVAASERCANGVFRLANHAIGIQGHPEFPPALLGKLIEARKKELGADEYKAALATLDTATDAGQMAKWCMNFVTTRA